jgi:hypothetical protein
VSFEYDKLGVLGEVVSAGQQDMNSKKKLLCWKEGNAIDF